MAHVCMHNVVKVLTPQMLVVRLDLSRWSEVEGDNFSGVLWEYHGTGVNFTVSDLIGTE